MKGILILAAKSGILVDGASIAANSSSIGTKPQNRLKQQRVQKIGEMVMVSRSFRAQYQELPELLLEWRDVERQEASAKSR